jgi:hypothetical protein
MQLVTNPKYRLSKNGGASQVILSCHGGWSTNDGKVFVPSGMVMHFYSAHGQFGTRGQAISEKMLGASQNTGLDQVTMSRLMNEMDKKKWSPEQLDEEILKAKASVNSLDMAQSMQIVDSVAGKGLGSRQKVYNYCLAYKGPRESEQPLENLFALHQKGTLDNQIDLMIMQPGAVGHLESAIAFARSKGEKYTAFHFLPCRYVDATDTKSMKTVNLPKDFGGEDFKQTSVL